MMLRAELPVQRKRTCQMRSGILDSLSCWYPLGGTRLVLTQGRRRGVPAQFGTSATTVFREELHQVTHTLGVNSIENMALLAPRPQEAGAFELREMRGHGRGGDADLGRNLARREALRGTPHQQPKHVQTVFLG